MITARTEVAGKPFPQWPVGTMPIERYVLNREHALYFEAVIELLAEVRACP